MQARWPRLGWLLASCATWSATAVEARAEGSVEQHDVSFESGHVEVDPKTGRMLLSQGFSLQVERYRLVGDSVSLSNSPGGVLVDGSGRLAFCLSPTPIVTFGFSSATVAPPGDLVLKDAVVRLGPVPVLWLPYLWLRSPERVGLIPPRFEYRAEEGFLGTTGLHLPLGQGQGSGLRSPFLDLRAGGYARGGGVGELSLATEATTTDIEVDYQKLWVYDVEARGNVNLGTDTLAWDADWRAGARARQSSVLLAEAATRFDHARMEVATQGSRGGVALGPVFLAARGQSAADTLMGPTTTFAFRTGFGQGFSLESSGDLVHLRKPTGDRSVSSGRSLTELSSYSHVGAVGVQGRATQALTFAAVTETAILSSQQTGALRLGLPLTAELNERADPLRHFMEPNFVLVANHLQVVQGGGEGRARAPNTTGTTLVLAPGWRNSLGQWGARRSGEVSVASGWVGRSSHPTLAHLGRVSVDVGWLSGGSRIAVSAHSSEFVSEIAVGEIGHPRLVVTQASASGSDAALAQGLEAWTLTEMSAFGWLSASGDSVAAELAVPLSSALAVSLAGDADAGDSQVLAVRGAAAYRHPCRCFAAAAWAGRRSGRRGSDVWATVDFMP